MKVLRWIVLAVFSLSSWSVFAGSRFPAIPSQIKLEPNHDILQIYPYPDLSLIDSYDHIQIPSVAGDGLSHIQSVGVLSQESFANLVEGHMQQQTMKMNAMLLIRQLARIKGGLIPAESLNKSLLLSAVSMNQNDDSIVTNGSIHRLQTVFPQQMPQKDLFPLKSSKSGDTNTSIDDSYAIAIRFVPRADALTQKIADTLGEYPFVTCLVEEGCGELPSSLYPQAPSDLSKQILAIRTQSSGDAGRGEGSTALRFKRLTELDTSLASDLVNGNIQRIEMIYAIPVFKSFSLDSAERIKNVLIGYRDRFNRSSTKEEAARVTLSFSWELTRQGVSDPIIQSHLLAKFFDDSGSMNLNQPDALFQFAAEKASYLSTLSTQGGPEAWMKKEVSYRFIAVGTELKTLNQKETLK